MNFYKRHIGDYLKDTAHLSLLEHGVYTRLLDVYYTRESGIPDDQAARLIGARGRDETAALKVVLAEFFELVDGTWIQDRCEREIRATGPTDGDGEAKPAKTGKALRQQAYRERRAALFEALRERGVTMPFKATMEELQDALLRVTKPAPVMPAVTGGVMPPVTDGPHNVTATISQTPDATSQTPDVNPEDRTDVGGQPRATVRPSELSAAMRRHSVDAQPGDPRIIAAAAAGVTVETIEAACAEAKSADPNGRIKAGFVLSIANRWTAEASAPRRVNPRATTQDRIREQNEATMRAFVGDASQDPDPMTIDMEH
jgi:uncharacterized protein YdaU (DUF1376 family)